MSSKRPPPPASGPIVGTPERRRDTRAPIELKVEYKRLNSFIADYTRNISKDGTFIATAKPLPVGTEFVFKLTIPKLDAPLQLNGKVTWIVPQEANQKHAAGMGIRFEYRDSAERDLVHGVMLKLMSDSLGQFLSQKLLADAENSETDARKPEDS